MKRLKALIGIVCALCIACSAICFTGCAADGQEERTLRFREDGTFRIVQITDTHQFLCEETGEGIAQYKMHRTLMPVVDKFIRDTVSREQADLYVLTGDVIFCNKTIGDLRGGTTNALRLLADIFEEEGAYWTMTFGNHDDQGVVTKKRMTRLLSGYKHFIGGIEDGDGYKAFVDSRDGRYLNLSIPVMSANGSEVLYNVFLLDCGSDRSTSDESKAAGYQYVVDSQVSWYESEVERLAVGGAVVPSVMFTHIPLIETEEAYNSGAEYVGAHGGFFTSDTRSRLYSAFKNKGDVRGAFYGHAHSNSLTIRAVDGAFTYLTGGTPDCGGLTASYHSPEDLPLHGRRITLYADGNLSTVVFTNGGVNLYDEVRLYAD